MARTLLLLALAGLASGLQAPLLYKYKYYGSISTGIPELSSQAAAWAMKANIEVYIEKDDGVAVFDIDSFKMVEFNGDLGCDSRGEIPDELFHRAEDNKINEAVESTFKVHLFNFEDFAIEDDSEEFPWLTNMRKGIASIFKNEILHGNLDSQLEGTIANEFHHGHAVHVFPSHEETIFGTCEVDYTVSLIPEYLAGTRNHELEQHVEQDIQRDYKKSSPLTSKTSKKSSKKYTSKSSKRGKTTKTAGKYKKSNVPDLKDDLWHVVRSVNFDHCFDVVSLQSSTIGIHKPITGGQYDWARGRSSTTEYIFRGSPGHARLEKAIVEGSTTQAPFGMKTELFQARTNQTLTLVSVTSLGKVPALPANCQQSKTWMHQVLSFAPLPKVSKPHPWVVYTGKGAASFRNYQLLGMPAYTDEEFDAIKHNITNYITEAAHRLTDLDQEEEPTDLYHPTVQEILLKAGELFQEISKEEILEIFDKFFEKSLHQHDTLAKKLVVDAAASSGSFFAYSAILDYIKHGKIPDLQIVTIFMSLTNNARCPSNIPEIMDYVLSLDIKEKPFLTATVLVNFAELVHEFCVNPKARQVSYAGPLFGDLTCQRELIKSRLVPYLTDIIYGPGTTWEKDVALEAVRALGSPFAFPILSEVIEGKVTCSDRVRSLAIYALASWKLVANDDFLKKPIIDLLTEVYSDIAEDAEVREAALITITSWHPEPNFWHTLARTSWREPSKQFSTFVSSLIYSFAHFEHPFFLKQNQAATHALRFAKPIAPSEKYSLVHMMTKRLIDKHVWKFETLQIHKNDHGFNEREFYYFLMTNLGGFEYINLELFTITDGFFEGYKNILAGKVKEGGAVGIAAKIAQDFYHRIQDTIQAETITRDPPSGGIFVKVFDHMSLYLPLNKETLSTTQFSDPTKLASLFVQLGLGYDLVLAKYVRPISVYSIYPTELGLPLSTGTIVSILYSEVSYVSLGLGGKSLSLESLKKLELSAESLARVSTLGFTGLFALLPWNSKEVGVGITSTRDVTLPVNGLLRTDPRDYEGGHQNVLHVEFQSLYKKKFPLVKASNIPYTAIFNIIPRDNRKGMNFKILLTKPPKEETLKLGSAFTGISTELHWNSEIALSTASLTLHEFLSHPKKVSAAPWLIYLLASPTVKFWNFEFHVDPALSKTKNVSIEFVTATYGKSGDNVEQFTQEAGGGEFSQYGQDSYDQYDQETFDVEQGFQEIGGQEVESINHINYKDTLQQRSDKLQSLFGGTAYSKSIKIDFDGDEHRSYEVIMAFSKSLKSQSRKVKKLQISFLRSPNPHIENAPTSLCLDVQKSMPAFSKLSTVEDLLAANLDKNFNAALTLDCTGSPIFEAKGTYKLSHKGLEKLKKTVPESCNYDPYNPLHTIHSEAVYDDIKLSLGWEKLCDSLKVKNPVAAKALGLLCNILPNHKADIELNRCPVRDVWHVSTAKHTKSFDVPNNNFFKYAFAIGKKHTFDFHPDHITTFNLEVDKCVIGDHSVRTFDGFTYDFEPTDCWTVAAKDCSVEEGKMLLVRSAKGELTTPDAKYIDTRRGLVIEYSNHVVRVNGKIVDPIGEEEIVKDDHGKFLVAIHKKHDFYMAKLSKSFYILAKNGKIKVQLPNNMRGKTCGLCGNFDGEPESELVGPHRCFYSDPKLFAASWSAGSDTCDIYTLLALREKVENYQKSCKTIETLYGTCPRFNKRCFEIGFKVHSLGDKYCISSSPIPHCDPNCGTLSASLKHAHEVDFNCWPKEHAPTIISEALAAGQNYTTHPVGEDPYYKHVHFKVALSTSCLRAHDESYESSSSSGDEIMYAPYGTDLKK